MPQLPIRSVSQPRVAELRGMALALWWFGILASWRGLSVALERFAASRHT